MSESNLRKDIFLSKVIKKNCYNLKNLKSISFLKSFRKNGFFSLKLKNKNNKKIIIVENKLFKFIDTELTFFGKIKKNISIEGCRIAKIIDKNKVIKIAKKELNINRFTIDRSFKSTINKKIKKEWTMNYFKKKRGDLMVLKFDKAHLVGFLLVIKAKNTMVIDLIAVSNKFKGKNYALQMILFAQNKLFNNTCNVQAGTIQKNKNAIRFYKKIGLKLLQKKKIFHHHS